MSGDIDMGGKYGGNDGPPEDSHFLKFIDRRLGAAVMGAGFGVYKLDEEGMLAT
jgi:hypothetical protein